MIPIVFSHQRSGTHFLINTLALNFRRDHRWQQNEIGTELEGENISSDAILKSHAFAQCLTETPTSLYKKGYQAFYVYRDPRDVMVSFWCMLQQNPSAQKRHFFDENLERFIFDYEPFQHAFDKRYGCFETGNLLKHWRLHVEGWFRKKSVVFVRYEDLFCRFHEVVQSLGQALGEKPPKFPQRPSPTWNVVEPRKGIPGDWRNFLDERLNERIKAEIGTMRKALSDAPCSSD